MANTILPFDKALNQDLLIESFRRLVPDLEIITYDNEDGSIIVPEVLPNCDTCPTVDMIVIKYNEIMLEYKQEEAKKDLMYLCDAAQNQVNDMILGYKNTPLQLDRYIDKYHRALAGTGSWDEEENQRIIANHEAYQVAIRSLIDKIEAFRMQADDLIITGNFVKLEEVLPFMQPFNPASTIEEINDLFL